MSSINVTNIKHPSSGSNNVVLDSSGNVGIGTNAPSALLDLGTATPIVRFSDTDTTGYHEIRSSNTNFIINADPSNADANSAISFNVDGSERARVDSSGNLLINTNASVASAAFSVEIVADDTSPFLTFARNDTSVAVNNLLGRIRFYGNDANGTYEECARIDAAADGTHGDGDKPTRLGFWTTADNESSPTERMRIKNSGQVVIGNSTAGDVTYGYKITAATDSDAYTYFGIGDSGAGENGRSRTSTTSSYVHLRLVNGNGGVGSITTSGSSTAYNTTSDYRLKENVAPLEAAISRLTQIPVHRFNFIADPDTTVDGFLAHEVQAIVPEAITGEKDAVDDDGNPIYQGIDQSKLVPLLTAALQEAIGRIETLEAEVAALKAQ